MPDNSKETLVPAPEEGGATPAAPSSSQVDGRIDRIVNETRQLGDDLMEWVNLRLKLIEMGFQERIDQELDLVFSGMIVISMIVIALLLASFGLAFILGHLLGDAWYGFAIMALIYLVAAGVISRLQPRLAAGFRSNWRKERLAKGTEASKTDD